ncbi:MAG: DUF302 domain-containing protein [SAR324 cluster bacterium]|nr:DUF302 domain-containing protein [SAR324 cluster bacterium]
MVKILVTILIFFIFTGLTLASDGVVLVKSSHTLDGTIDRLVKVLKAKGMTIFANIDHAQGAKKVGQKLRPTKVLVFGNPKIGSLIMKCNQLAAIDLPQKAMVFQDKNGQVWLAYNDPTYLSERHAIKGCQKPLKKIKAALAKFAEIATE